MQSNYKGEEMNKLFSMKYVAPFLNSAASSSAKQGTLTQAQQAPISQAKSSKKPEKEKKIASYLQEENKKFKYQGKNYEQIMKMKLDKNEPFDQQYFSQEIESSWQQWWEQKEFFKANADNVLKKGKKPYVMVLPPPNVTGMLHIGHGLTSAVEDAIIRRKRMQGFETLYLPGQDHAGIATHSVVEKQLIKTEGKSRHDLGREKFVERIWDWKNKNGEQILQQLRLLGSSLDWSRFHFTMDDQLSKAVNESFVRFYDMGLIYRANRLVNWSCKLKTAISDIEVDYMEFDKPKKIQVPGHDGWYTFGELTHFCYYLKGDKSKTIEVATTRLETMLGDTGLAVNSKDPRYKEFHGKILEHPFFPDREIRVVVDDELVDMEYGTGAVKITPAHDPNDYLCGEKHNLEFINIFDDEGLINHNGGKYKGMKRFDLRKQLEIDLQELGLLRGKTPNPMKIGICSRSKDIIEPMLRPQWYMKNSVAEQMIDVVNKGELNIEPAEFKKVWEGWLTTPKDWCISRQLWWGHRIPAYTVEVQGSGKKPDIADGNDWVIGRNHEEALEKAAKKFNVSKDKIILNQDEDVLDTWFSSGLFPFSTMGWPDEGDKDFQAFFPNQILETGHDILFFWVARMVQMSLLLTGKLPFKDVYLHPIIRDADGKKMSKSSGNVIDPREIIYGCSLQTLIDKLTAPESNLPPKEVERSKKNHQKNFPKGIPECGSDALRFSLLAYMQKNRFINLDLNRIIGYRESCNKIFQSFKFGYMYLPKDYKYVENQYKYSELSFLNQWILHIFNKNIKKINDDFDSLDFGDVATQFMHFWKYNFCDVYVEACKPIFQQSNSPQFDQTIYTLFTCLHLGIKLLHPLMPFLSEELYQKLPAFATKRESITIAEYPEFRPDWQNDQIEAQFKNILDIGKAVRQICTQLNIPPKIQPETFIVAQKPEIQQIIKQEQQLICKNAKATLCDLVTDESKIPKGCIKTAANGDIEVHCNIKEHIDIKAELKRLDKKIAELVKQQAAINKKKQNPTYSTKVPENIRQQDDKNLEELNKQISILQSSQNELKSL